MITCIHVSRNEIGISTYANITTKFKKKSNSSLDKPILIL